MEENKVTGQMTDNDTQAREFAEADNSEEAVIPRGIDADNQQEESAPPADADHADTGSQEDVSDDEVIADADSGMDEQEDTSETDEHEDTASEYSGKTDKNRTRIVRMLRPVINIAWMYPDTLYLHGERGNVMALVKYAAMLGLEPKLHRIDLGTANFNPMDYDILFYGPGEISSFKEVINDIGTYTCSLAEYLASGKVMIVTGTTVAMFAERIRRFSPDAENGMGEVIDGLCLIPAIAEEREYVAGDDEDVRAEYGGYSMELIGNQIQMADIEFYENSNYRRFGSVIYGHGNNGSDGMEGIVYGNSIFTNMLGPVLVGNPWLTVQILKAAAELKGIEIRQPDPDYSFEVQSFQLKKKFIEDKRTDQ